MTCPPEQQLKKQQKEARDSDTTKEKREENRLFVAAPPASQPVLLQAAASSQLGVHAACSVQQQHQKLVPITMHEMRMTHEAFCVHKSQKTLNPELWPFIPKVPKKEK